MHPQFGTKPGVTIIQSITETYASYTSTRPSKMITVAVPGGTSSGLGRAVVTALKQYDEITPVVLSRQSSSVPQWLKVAGVEVRKVDYSSEESLYNALQGVHTVCLPPSHLVSPNTLSTNRTADVTHSQDPLRPPRRRRHMGHHAKEPPTRRPARRHIALRARRIRRRSPR